MFINDDSITAKVYYKKPGMDFYLVSVSMSDIGLFISSIIVDRDKNNELRVKPPKLTYHDKGKFKTVQQVEFDKNKELWNIIVVLALEAVDAQNGIDDAQPP